MGNKVVTVGLGYIGLPTSALIAQGGIEVIGVDVNKYVVETINKGNVHIVEPQLDEVVKAVVKEGIFKASMEVEDADVFLIVVPTPFKDNHEPDISFVEKATKTVIPHLQPFSTKGVPLCLHLHLLLLQAWSNC